MYEKELDVVMSTSYGPGRYDPVYELEGQDYPLGYVRWTENRNMEEYLRLLATGALDLSALPQERFEIDEAETAYAALGGERKSLLVLLSYPGARRGRSAPRRDADRRSQSGRINVALVGAGAFAQGSHVPNLQKLDGSFEIRAVTSRTGATAKAVASRVQAAYATTDCPRCSPIRKIDLVLIATRHDLHAAQALRGAAGGQARLRREAARARRGGARGDRGVLRASAPMRRC